MTTKPRWTAEGNAVFEDTRQPARVLCYDDERFELSRYELARRIAGLLNAADAALDPTGAGAAGGHDHE